MRGQISVDADHFVALLANLEYVVVSLDRIGSAALPAPSRAMELERFIVEGDVFTRLAMIRRSLSEAMDKCLSNEERERIEQELERVQAWVVSQQARP
jgi:hypothetical protein